MQAIVTKYHGPTDKRGSRISASCEAGRISIPYPHELSSPDAHEAAAQALLGKVGLSDKWRIVGGGLPGRGAGYAFVMVPR